MATIMGIPTLIQEQNSYPGVTTRLLASRVTEVHLSFERSARFLSARKNIRMTGNPVRSTVGRVSVAEGRSFFGLMEERATVLVFGGSLGAHALNTALGGCLKDLVNHGAQVIWQTGSQDLAAAQDVVKNNRLSDRVRVLEFIDRMEYAYGAATVAVCRSGATTIAELTVSGLPSILVPYPFAAADHQTHNAAMMADAGAAEMLKEGDLTELLPRLSRLLGNGELLDRMAAKAKEMARPKAATDLADAIIKLAGNQNVG
jgi:UDP-N-acetylglucosamine--N-acetylmuramyl-(pentapeptide) pyrophosphoryl-undecaprenol N-acetylglucosamine transferase